MTGLHYRIRITEKCRARFVVLASTRGGWQSTPFAVDAWTCSKATADATARRLKQLHPALSVKVEIAT